MTGYGSDISLKYYEWCDRWVTWEVIWKVTNESRSIIESRVTNESRSIIESIAAMNAEVPLNPEPFLILHGSN